MADYHEPTNELTASTRDFSRALKSLQEELEAIDWYQQRVDTASDESLKRVLLHNRNEEMEHACMTLEWLRRNMDGWNDKLNTYLYTTQEITEIEDDEENDKDDASDQGALNLS